MRFFATFALILLAACQPVPAPEKPGATTPAGRVFYFGQALYGDPVFDRDVLAVQAALAGRPGGLAAAVPVGNHLSGTQRLSQAQASAALAGLARQAEDGRDLVVVLLTTHGRPGALSVQLPGVPAQEMDAAALKRFLAPLEADRHVVILQACYSGSLIPALQSPNRIILTAARADRPSFGCHPGAQNTWFVRALSGALAQGGDWKTVFERTRARVHSYESGRGIRKQSEPQSSIGSAMGVVWSAAR